MRPNGMIMMGMDWNKTKLNNMINDKHKNAQKRKTERLNETTCSEYCPGINIMRMRTGDPIVSYRQCAHGRALKIQHASMTNQQIRSSLAETVKFRRPKTPASNNQNEIE
jgi:hypothetical protein